MVLFGNLFRPELADSSLIPQLENESEDNFGYRNELYETPAVFSSAELDELKKVSSFWSEISRKIREKLLSQDEQLLSTFPELIKFNDSTYSRFQIPPLMRLDTLISEDGVPQIIECNSQFPGNTGAASVQALNYLRRNKKISDSILPLNSHTRFLEFLLSQETPEINFVEIPNNSHALDTKFFGYELEKKGIIVKYRTSNEDLSDLYGLVVKRVIPRNLQLEELVRKERINLINPSWSYFVGNKRLFPLFRNSDFIQDFNDYLIQGIHKYIPETSYVSDIKQSRKLEIVDDKDLYVLKYPDSYGGDGVFIGAEKSSSEWENIMNSPNSQNAVLQKRVNAMTYNGNSFDIGIMMIGGEFSNPWMRISKKESLKTNMHGGGRSVACYKELI
ncbi:MAG: hypothetical protein ACLFPL_00995 [Candidatus Nanoarchaeia archaeon]